MGAGIEIAETAGISFQDLAHRQAALVALDPSGENVHTIQIALVGILKPG
jgi:hypothetical protein